MRNRQRAIISLLFAGLLFSACKQQVVYHHFEHVAEEEWDKFDDLTFEIPPVSEEGTYREEAELRIDRTYPFQGLSLLVEQTVYPSGVRHLYVLKCDLIDKHGRIKGDGISYFMYRIPVGTVSLNEGDSIHISVKHNMKRETMTGITDLGIKLSKE